MSVFPQSLSADPSEGRMQVALTPMLINDYVVAILLTFPPSMAELCKRFNAPEDFQSAVLVSTVIPLSITAKQKELEWKDHTDKPTKLAHQFDKIVTAERRKNLLRFSPKYCRALRCLDFPKSLDDFLSSSVRMYCVWPSVGERNSLETDLLISILDRNGAKNAGFKGDVRLIFLHVGAMKSLSHLPALAEKRNKQPQIRFYTYGSHENVTPLRWQIREVFPIGA